MEQFNEHLDDSISYIPPDEEPALIEQDLSHSRLFLGCPKTTKLPFVIIFMMIIGVYFVTTFFISNIVLLPMQVDGGSMYPTLNYEYETSNNSYAKDVVYLWKTTNVEYGDIVVFNALPYSSSTSDELYFIKRVIAIGGDTIQFKRVGELSMGYMAEYVVYKNGEILNEDYISSKMLFNVLSETYEDVINEEIIIVPEGYVYLMGDNRNNSKDSREFGLVHTSDIVGKVKIHIPYGHTFLYGIFTSIKNGYLI